MTAHWICPQTLQRRSANIALKRIIGSHTGDLLAKMILDVLLEYNIISKVIKIVTDNAANFIKALKETADIRFNEVGLEIISLTKILKSATHIHNIPIHQRCSAHTLNLCMTSDISKTLKKVLKESTKKQDTEADESESDDEVEDVLGDDDLDVTIIDSAIIYRDISKSAFGKCKSLWNKQSRSSYASDIIKQTFGVYLVTPNDTRWNSLLDSLVQLLSFIKDKATELKTVFKKLKLDFFNADEVNFMENYVSVSIFIECIFLTPFLTRS